MTALDLRVRSRPSHATSARLVWIPKDHSFVTLGAVPPAESQAFTLLAGAAELHIERQTGNLLGLSAYSPRRGWRSSSSRDRDRRGSFADISVELEDQPDAGTVLSLGWLDHRATYYRATQVVVWRSPYETNVAQWLTPFQNVFIGLDSTDGIAEVAFHIDRG